MHAYTGAKLDVSIVTGLSANSFWAELVVDDSAYTDMMTLMERWEWDTMVSTPDVGDFCVSQYSVDGCWYRALVESTTNGKVCVYVHHSFCRSYLC